MAILFVIIYGKEEFTEMHEIAKKANEKALKDIQTQEKSYQETMRNIIKNLFPPTQISPQKGTRIEGNAAVRVKGESRSSQVNKIIGG